MSMRIFSYVLTAATFAYRAEGKDGIPFAFTRLSKPQGLGCISTQSPRCLTLEF
jgi:hypothetical protein